MADATIVRWSALVFGPDGQVLLVRRSRGPDPDYVNLGGDGGRRLHRGRGRRVPNGWAVEGCGGGLCPEFVDLDRLGGLRLLPPIAGHIRGFARDRNPATIPILGNLWRSHLGSSRG